MLALTCRHYPATLRRGGAVRRRQAGEAVSLRTPPLYTGAGTSKDSVDCIYRSSTRALAMRVFRVKLEA